MEHKIVVAGIGPGHPQYILPAAREAIASAKVLAGGSRALAEFAHAGQKTARITGDMVGILRFLQEALEQDDVVVMVSGDPGYFSFLEVLRREFSPDRLVVIPGISSLQFAFARLALPWQSARLLSLHGRSPQVRTLAYVPDALLGILTDTKYTSRTVAVLLQENGWPGNAEMFICSRLSYEDEQIVATTLSEAVHQASYKNCVLVVRA